jgi:hypothetical protein
MCFSLTLGTAAMFPAPDEARYDYRASPAYAALPPAQRLQIDQVHRDMVLLWGALDLYADHNSGRPPAALDQLVPLYLQELPRDPFATDEAAAATMADLLPYTSSCGGWGYRYRLGRGRSWIIASVGLPDFPYLADRGNIGLYLPKGTWISGRQPEPGAPE